LYRFTAAQIYVSRISNFVPRLHLNVLQFCRCTNLCFAHFQFYAAFAFKCAAVLPLQKSMFRAFPILSRLHLDELHFCRHRTIG